MKSNEIAKTDRLKTSIGDVVIKFQFIENELSEILCALLQMKEKEDQHRICAAMSFKQKVDLTFDLYPERKKKNWPELDIRAVRKALNAAEGFRNSIVHSFWYVSGVKKIVWMRSKSSLRSKSGLNYTDGVANINGIENGIKSLEKIRNWYLGNTEELNKEGA